MHSIPMKYLLLFIGVIFSNISYSQCGARLLTGTFDNVRFILPCPAFQYSFTPHNNEVELNVLNHNNIDLVKEEFLNVESIVRQHILNKTTNYFLDHLKFYSLDIVSTDRIDDFKHRISSIDMKRCSAKYSIYYYFEPMKNVKYCVGFTLDNTMRIITTDNFPHGNIEHFQQTTICEIYDLGTKYLKVPTEDLKLIVYNNKFYWSLIEKINYRQGRNQVQKLLIEAANLNNYLTLNEEVYVDF